DTHWHSTETYDPEHDFGVIVEIDWTSSKAGTLAVNRQRLEESTVGKNARRWLHYRAIEITREFAISRQNSQFKRLNLRIAHVPTLPVDGEKWAAEPSEGGSLSLSLNVIRSALALLSQSEETLPLCWNEINLPAVSKIGWSRQGEWRWRGKP